MEKLEALIEHSLLLMLKEVSLITYIALCCLQQTNFLSTAFHANSNAQFICKNFVFRPKKYCISIIYGLHGTNKIAG